MKKFIRTILFKSKLLNILRFLKVPERIYKHLYFKGKFKVKVGNGSFFWIQHYGYQLENDIFWSGITGKYEGKSLETWIKLSKNSNVIFDVGANTGVFALAAASSNPNAKVFAFEPLNAVFKKLEKNILLNNLDIIPVKKALSNTNGTQNIYISDNNHDYWASLSVQRLKDFSESKEEEIEKTDFVTFVESLKLNKVDLLKIDVEYHEVEVLEGMRNYIEKWKPDMLIEIVDAETASKIYGYRICKNE